MLLIEVLFVETILLSAAIDLVRLVQRFVRFPTICLEPALNLRLILASGLCSAYLSFLLDRIYLR